MMREDRSLTERQCSSLLWEFGIGNLPPEQRLQRPNYHDSPPSHKHKLFSSHQCLSSRWHHHHRPKQHFPPLGSLICSAHLQQPPPRNRRTRQRRRCKPSRLTTFPASSSHKLLKASRRRPTSENRKTMVHQPLRPRNVLSSKPSRARRPLKFINRNLQHRLPLHLHHPQYNSSRDRQRNRIPPHQK